MPILILGGGSAATATGRLATILPGQVSAHYRRIALWTTPASDVTYRVDYERDVTDLVNGADEPSLPVRFHRLLATGARMKEYEKREDWKRYQLAKQQYDSDLKDLRYFLQSGTDYRPVMGRRIVQRPSQLGGQFASGT